MMSLLLALLYVIVNLHCLHRGAHHRGLTNPALQLSLGRQVDDDGEVDDGHSTEHCQSLAQTQRATDGSVTLGLGLRGLLESRHLVTAECEAASYSTLYLRVTIDLGILLSAHTDVCLLFASDPTVSTVSNNCCAIGVQYTLANGHCTSSLPKC